MSSRAREWGIALVVALAAVALTIVPYALGYVQPRPGWSFAGVVMNPEDSQSYFAKMLEGYDGAWLYTIPFTPEEHAPALVGTFYVALGHLARVCGLKLLAVWHLARVVSALMLFLTTFGFISGFLPDARSRWTAYLLAVFGSGLGWVLFLLGQPYWLDVFPVDFKMPEAHLFFSALTYPHVSVGTALILAVLWFIQRAAHDGVPWRSAVWAGVFNLGLAIAYPFLIYLTAATTGIYWIWLSARARQVLWRQAFAFAVAFLIPAPLVAGYAWTLATNPVLRVWDAQAITASPPLPHYMIAYGVMLLLAGLVARTRNSAFTLLWAWLAAVVVLLYAPLNAQRRFVEGVHVPLAILAATGLVQVVLPWLGRTRPFRWLAARPRYSLEGLERLILILFLAAMSLSNLYILASLSVTMTVQQPDLLFRPTSEVAAVEWLRANSARTDRVLADYETGNYVAAHAGNRVVLGHWAETVGYESKTAEVARFYAAATDDAFRRTLIARYGVRYVWQGFRERKLGDYDPARAGYLQPAFTNSDLTIYQVRP